MGVVWLAEDSVLQRQVAIKEVEFPAGVPEDEVESLRARVMREARAAGRLNHPNVTTIYDVVVDEGRTWIVMEYVDAPTVTEMVSREGPLSVDRTARIGLSVLAALEAAHASGIVHRDVKPSNVMVKSDGIVKLADFGVAAVAGDPKITMTGLIIGSPSYMAPEQAREGRSTEATDLWGLGTTLYFAVEGQPAFDRGAAIATLTAVTHEDPRPFQRAGPLQPVIERLLQKNPQDRLTAGELRAALDELVSDADGGSPTAVTPAPVPTPTSAATHAIEPEVEEDDWTDTPPPREPEYAGAVAVPRRRSPWPVLLGVLALLLLAGLVLSDRLGGQDEVAGTAQDGGKAQDEAGGRGDDNAPAGGGGAAEPAAGGDTAGDQADDPAPQQDPAAGDDADDTAVEDDADGAESAEVPADWSTFAIGDTGATVAHPPDWSAVPRGGGATDLVDPAGGRYLRLQYTDTPKDDAVEDWEAQSASFAQRHDNYNEISIQPYDYNGHEAALWEYTYYDGGAQLHAYNLAIVAGGRGYALNFQTRESQWAQSQQLWEQFVASVAPAD